MHARSLLIFLGFCIPATVTASELAFWQEPVRDAKTFEAAHRALRQMGYDPGTSADPAAMSQALAQAQKDRELEPTGELDRRTAAALGVDVEARRPARTAAAGGRAGPQPR